MSYLENAKGLGARGLHAGISTLGGFQKFILRGNVVDLAVGIVIGAAFNAVVQEFVKDLITPFIGVFGHFDYSKWTASLNGSTFYPGLFVNAVISFLITALAVYFFVVLPVNKLIERFTPHKDETPTTHECPYCLSSIPLKATRCAFCTAQLPATGQAVS